MTNDLSVVFLCLLHVSVSGHFLFDHSCEHLATVSSEQLPPEYHERMQDNSHLSPMTHRWRHQALPDTGEDVAAPPRSRHSVTPDSVRRAFTAVGAAWADDDLRGSCPGGRTYPGAWPPWPKLPPVCSSLLLARRK